MDTIRMVMKLILLMGCSVTMLSCGKRDQNEAIDGSTGSLDAGKPGGQQTAKDAPRKLNAKPRVAANTKRQHVLATFVAKWEEVVHENRGPNASTKQKELALGTIAELGGCPELMKFLDFLSSKGASELRKSIIDSDLAVVFAGPGAKDAREWLLTLDDKKLKEQLFRQAGEMFTGLGFKEYFELTGVVAGLNCQAALLTGYCVAMAKTDPEGAVRVYREFAYPKHIDNSGMADIMSVIPANADFMKFATEIKEDSMTLARRARAALLKNWTSVKPQDAAQYVLASSANTVNPEQMGVVIDTWAGKSPDAAAEWLNKAPAGKPRDEGIAALAKFWCATDITKAWQFAGQVGDFKKRVDTATVVFKEWEKTDKSAATAAWVALFPQ